MKRLLIISVLFLLLHSSCKKESIDLLTYEVDSHTTHQLRKVFFVDDSVGYIVGGSRYEIGIVLQTADGGKTWSQPDSVFLKNIYAAHFFTNGEGFIGGYDSWWGYTADSGQSFSVTTGDYKPINDLHFYNRSKGVRVSGDGYSEGHISTTNDGGISWTASEKLNTMRAAEWVDKNVIYASGYGVIYKSVDGGNSFKPCDARGDFFVSLDFVSSLAGYFAGYQGLILKTTDGGNSFKKVHPGNAPFGKRIHWEAIKFWDENTGYVAGDDGLFYRTENGGDTWQVAQQFTSVNLRSIHLFSANDGIVVGDEGKIILFKY